MVSACSLSACPDGIWLIFCVSPKTEETQMRYLQRKGMNDDCIYMNIIDWAAIESSFIIGCGKGIYHQTSRGDISLPNLIWHHLTSWESYWFERLQYISGVAPSLLIFPTLFWFIYIYLLEALLGFAYSIELLCKVQ